MPECQHNRQLPLARKLGQSRDTRRGRACAHGGGGARRMADLNAPPRLIGGEEPETMAKGGDYSERTSIFQACFPLAAPLAPLAHSAGLCRGCHVRGSVKALNHW